MVSITHLPKIMLASNTGAKYFSATNMFFTWPADENFWHYCSKVVFVSFLDLFHHKGPLLVEDVCLLPMIEFVDPQISPQMERGRGGSLLILPQQ